MRNKRRPANAAATSAVALLAWTTFAAACPCSYTSDRLTYITSTEPISDNHAFCLSFMDKFAKYSLHVGEHGRGRGIYRRAAEAMHNIITKTDFNNLSISDAKDLNASSRRDLAKAKREYADLRQKREEGSDYANDEAFDLNSLNIISEQAWVNYTACELAYLE